MEKINKDNLMELGLQTAAAVVGSTGGAIALTLANAILPTPVKTVSKVFTSVGKYGLCLGVSAAARNEFYNGCKSIVEGLRQAKEAIKESKKEIINDEEIGAEA